MHDGDGARRDVAQDFPAAERVDERMRAGHAEEEERGVAARDVEDQDAEDHVEDEVRVAAHVQGDAATSSSAEQPWNSGCDRMIILPMP